MAPDKKRAGGSSKVQPTASTKPALKQRTLFDSFTKNTMKNVPAAQLAPSELEGVEANVETSSSTDEPTDKKGPQPIEVDATVPPQNDAMEVVEVVDDPPIDDVTSVQSSKATAPFHNDVMEIMEVIDDPQTNDGTTVQIAQATKKRSPSILILEETSISMLPPTTGGPSTIPKDIPRRNRLVEGKTKDRPITIPASPIKAPASLALPNKPIHPFFAVKQKLNAPPSLPQTIPPPKETKSATAMQADQLPNYPDRLSQHVKGVQTTFDQPQRIFSSRRTRLAQPSHETEPMNYDFLKRCTSFEYEPSSSRGIRPSILNPNSTLDISEEAMTSHPAIARLMDLQPEDTPISHRPWSEKWRPSCAQEVLGNEGSAIYLRDWLRALELQLEDSSGATAGAEAATTKEDSSALARSKQKTKAKANGNIATGGTRGTKRPRVVRAVEKTRRKKSRLDSDEEDNNWIVYTDEEEEGDDTNYDDLDDLLVGSSPTSSPSSSAHDLLPTPTPIPTPTTEKPEPPNLGLLHNTILLSGPSGCGKTASVYACAEELGWDVFEVYPGIGRRNGVNVDNLIGEVGKNHLVIQNKPPVDAMKSFLRKKGKDNPVDLEEGISGSRLVSSYSPRKKTNGLPTQETEEIPGGGTRAVRQSLILLEEVDILFKEDASFWTTVTRIIRECKRPVICTCNDISLVPIQDLPLQCILNFTPCPTEATTTYLRALCMAEGYSVGRDELQQLYEKTPVNTSGGVSRTRIPDLRGAINALEVICSSAVEEPPTSPEANAPPNGKASSSETPPGLSMRRREFLSCIDSDIGADVSRVVVDHELAGHIGSEDDEIGHVILHDLHSSDMTPLVLYDRQQEIVSAAVEISRGLFDMNVGEDEPGMEEDKRRIEAQQKAVVNAVCPIGIRSRSDGSLWMDYVPIVRQMVATEDKQEQDEVMRRPRGGRLTRNSSRRNFERLLDVGIEVGQEALMSGYRCSVSFA